MRRVLLTGLIGLTTTGIAAAQQAITITPSVGVQESYIYDKTQGQTGQTDLVTSVTPGVTIAGETPHVKVNFVYQPTFNHYDLGNSPDDVDQSLNAQATITPILDKLTIDLTANASEAGGAGNASNQQNILVPSGNRVLYYAGSISPHYQDHIGDFGTIDILLGADSTNTSVQGNALPGLGIGSSNQLGLNEEIALGTADTFGRLGLKLDAKNASTSGSGMNTASRNNAETLSSIYHLNRVYAVNGSVGLQSIRYAANGTTQGYKNSGLTWSLGTTITPNDVSQLTLDYGYTQGSYNPSIQAGYALGPRTNLSISYVVTVQNQLSSILQNQRFISFDQFGNAVDTRTGLPFSTVNQTFGAQNVLFRDKPAQISLSHQFERAAVTLIGLYEDRTSLVGPKASNKTWSVNVNYSRELTPRVNGNFNIGYTDDVSSGLGSAGFGIVGVGGTLTNPNGPSTDVHSITLSASIFYRLNDTITFNVSENYYKAMSNFAGNGSLTQQLTVGLTKSF